MIKAKLETKSEKLERLLKEPKRKLAEMLVNCNENISLIIKERNELANAKNIAVQSDVIKSYLACDVCGNHPNVIITTQFGTYCQLHAKYV